jgi:hypothetical protein
VPCKLDEKWTRAPAGTCNLACAWGFRAGFPVSTRFDVRSQRTLQRTFGRKGPVISQPFPGFCLCVGTGPVYSLIRKKERISESSVLDRTLCKENRAYLVEHKAHLRPMTFELFSLEHRGRRFGLRPHPGQGQARTRNKGTGRTSLQRSPHLDRQPDEWRIPGRYVPAVPSRMGEVSCSLLQFLHAPCSTHAAPVGPTCSRDPWA